MTTITKFDLNNVKALSKEMEKELAAIAAKYGLKIVQGVGGKYDAAKVSFKFEVAVTDTATVTDEEKKLFEMYARLYSFEPEDYGRVATNPLDGKSYAILGFNTRKHKNGLKVRCVQDGKMYAAPDSWVKLWKGTV